MNFPYLPQDLFKCNPTVYFTYIFTLAYNYYSQEHSSPTTAYSFEESTRNFPSTPHDSADSSPTMGSWSQTVSFEQFRWQPKTLEQHRPEVSRATTRFEDFVPVHQVKTWQEVDDEELQRRRALSISCIASKGAKKVKMQLEKVIKKRD